MSDGIYEAPGFVLSTGNSGLCVT